MLASAPASAQDAVFIHHSVGYNWLATGLDAALVAKPYIQQRNDIDYGTTMAPDAGRPASLGSVPGDSTNMNHWLLWFNDYLLHVRAHQVTSGYNRIIMFKSCFPVSDISADGTEPGDPSSNQQTLANYKAVYRHPAGPGNRYSIGGYSYKPLEDVFAEHPDILFIPVTAPPLNYTGTTDANAHRARLFNNWLKTEWLASYRARHPALQNVAVFDLFDVLAYPGTDPSHPNRLREEYGGATGDAHPTAAGNAAATQVFATAPDNFIDRAFAAFISAGIARRFDVDGNGTSDVVWRHGTRGEVWVWPMNGTTVRSESYVDTVADLGYEIVGSGDYDGDAKADLLWRHAMRGEVWVWLMDGRTKRSETRVDTVDIGYQIAGTGDYDGDGKADILWHHPTNGQVWIWLMDGATKRSQTWVGTVPDVRYQIVGSGDHDGDGKADVLWRHPTNGQVWIWLMDGATRRSQNYVDTVEVGYQIVGTGDYDGDGKADILWHHMTLGQVWVWLMDGPTRRSQTWVATVRDVGYQVVNPR